MADTIIRVIPSRDLPQALPDNTQAGTPVRGNRFGEMSTMNVFPTTHPLSDEGGYFVATNPTPGTGIAMWSDGSAVQDIKPFLLLHNNAAIQDGMRCYLDYLWLYCTAAGTAGASVKATVKLDGPNVSRYTSGGTQITPVNTNMNNGRVSRMQIYSGAVTAAAASSAARQLGTRVFRQSLPVINDQFALNFGGTEFNINAANQTGGTAIVNEYVSVPFPPVVIGPQEWCAIHLWLPSQTAASSWEFDLGYCER